MIKIEKGIPIPTELKKGPKYKFPFPEMNVGDSFEISSGDYKNIRTAESSLRGAASHFCTNHNLDWKFEIRKTENGVRTWRVK